MKIEKLNTNTGYITLTMSDEELRGITNLLCVARGRDGFKKKDYELNAKLLTAVTILHHGCIPAEEHNIINRLYELSEVSK